jgi:hypothetical protein
MDRIGLETKIFIYSQNIDLGRKGLRKQGQEPAGRLNFEDGINGSIAVFAEVRDSGDIELMILAEIYFLKQELSFCENSDTPTISSLTQAIDSFKDVLLALEASKDKVMYKGADKTHPHHQIYRIYGMPKDALHIACIAHRTRLGNMDRVPGVNPLEKGFFQVRRDNMTTLQKMYLVKQQEVLSIHLSLS